MNGVFNILRSNPEIVIFLALALGFYIGGLKFGKFRSDNVAGRLLAGGFDRRSGNRPALDQRHPARRRGSHFYHRG